VGLAFPVFAVAACAGLITAAVLVPAPAAVLPLLLVVCVAGPMVAASELLRLVPVLRGARDLERRHRRALDALPEIEHPLGL
jgi:hypothetical protein